MSRPRILKHGEFFGERNRPLKVNGITLTQLVHRHRRELPVHTHESAYFSMLLGGSYREAVGAKTFEYRQRSVALHPANFTHHDFIGDAGGTFFMVELSSDWLERLRTHFPQLALEPAFLKGEARQIFSRLYTEYQQADEWSPVAVEGMVLEAVAAACRLRAQAETVRPQWLPCVCDRLHSCFRTPLSVQQLAEDAGVDPIHLGRTFKRHMGESIKRYVHRMRVDYVAHRLRESDLSLAEIAYDAGFADQSHLTRIFRREIGTTPAEFRKRLN
jgi:AraC family transcriptional regulator